MASVPLLLRDRGIYDFCKKALARGYGRYGIPEDVPGRMVDALKTGKPLDSAVPELKHGRSVFWAGRKRYERANARHEAEFGLIKKWLDGGTVLEVGCGIGALGLMVSRRCKIREFIGTDTHLPKRTRGAGRARFLRQRSKTEIPVEDGSADTILLMDMLHHVGLGDQPALLRNAMKKLKEGGVLVLFEYAFSERKRPRLGAPPEFRGLSRKRKFGGMKVIDWIGNILVGHKAIDMPYAYRTLEGWERLFSGLGFRKIESAYLGFPKGFFHQGPYSLLVLRKG